jgi:hypothetical protein
LCYLAGLAMGVTGQAAGGPLATALGGSRLSAPASGPGHRHRQQKIHRPEAVLRTGCLTAATSGDLEPSVLAQRLLPTVYPTAPVPPARETQHRDVAGLRREHVPVRADMP